MRYGTHDTGFPGAPGFAIMNCLDASERIFVLRKEPRTVWRAPYFTA